MKKYVAVTGASGGMGAACVKRLCDDGYTVIALDRRECEASEDIIPIRVDVTSDDSVREAAARVAKLTDKLYAIVHFAGVYRLDSLVECESEKFIGSFDVNLFGVYRINREFLPLLGDGSRIIITTSELAPLDPLPFTGIYAITKSALDKYAYSLRMELQLLGITVTVLRPGAVATDMLGVSTSELDCFIENTRLYSCNAKRFKEIVEGVEARNIPPKRVAALVERVLEKRRPRQVYSINRNPLLLLLSLLPKRLQTYIIKLVLKP